MNTLSRFFGGLMVFEALVVYAPAAVQAGEQRDERLLATNTLSEVVEANCGKDENYERAGFLREIWTKIQTNLAQVTQELRADERFLLDPKSSYVQLLGASVDELSKQITKIHTKVMGLNFEKNIENHAVAVYQNQPSLAGELKRHEERSVFFTTEITKANRAIASLNDLENSKRQRFQFLSAQPDALQYGDPDFEKALSERRAKLPAVRSLAGRLQQLETRARTCLAQADPTYEQSLKHEDQFREIDIQKSLSWAANDGGAMASKAQVKVPEHEVEKAAPPSVVY